MADLETEHDLLDHTGLPGVSGSALSVTTVRRTSAQNVGGSGTLTSISWESELEDDDGAWAIGTPTQIVIPAGLNGRKVVVIAHLQWTASSAGTYRGLYLKHNAAFPGADLRYGVGAGLSVFQSFTSYPITVATGNTFEAQMRADTTGIGAVVSGSTFMSMYTVD